MVLRVVIEGPVKIGGHHAHKVSAELLVIKTALYLAHALGIGVALIGGVGRAKVEPCFSDRVTGDGIRVDARAQTTNQPLDFELVAKPHDVAVDREVLLPETDFVLHVGVKAAHFCRQVDHVRRLQFLEERLSGGGVRQVSVLPGREKEAQLAQ